MSLLGLTRECSWEGEAPSLPGSPALPPGPAAAERPQELREFVGRARAAGAGEMEGCYEALVQQAVHEQLRGRASARGWLDAALDSSGEGAEPVVGAPNSLLLQLAMSHQAAEGAAGGAERAAQLLQAVEQVQQLDSTLQCLTEKAAASAHSALGCSGGGGAPQPDGARSGPTSGAGGRLAALETLLHRERSRQQHALQVQSALGEECVEEGPAGIAELEPAGPLQTQLGPAEEQLLERLLEEAEAAAGSSNPFDLGVVAVVGEGEGEAAGRLAEIDARLAQLQQEAGAPAAAAPPPAPAGSGSGLDWELSGDTSGDEEDGAGEEDARQKLLRAKEESLELSRQLARVDSSLRALRTAGVAM